VDEKTDPEGLPFEHEENGGAFGGFGGLHRVVLSGNHGRNRQHAVIGKIADLGFEIAGNRVTERA
jgi:hypothetical protein